MLAVVLLTWQPKNPSSRLRKKTSLPVPMRLLRSLVGRLGVGSGEEGEEEEEEERGRRGEEGGFLKRTRCCESAFRVIA